MRIKCAALRLLDILIITEILMSLIKLTLKSIFSKTLFRKSSNHKVRSSLNFSRPFYFTNNVFIRKNGYIFVLLKMCVYTLSKMQLYRILDVSTNEVVSQAISCGITCTSHNVILSSPSIAST